MGKAATITYTIRVSRSVTEWMDVLVTAKTPEEAQRIAKQKAPQSKNWQRGAPGRLKTRVVILPTDGDAA